jgi:2-polyprenyl-3-methyl-5-hydroxy-6-metoxy-1,4-benzoquinol methylase
MTRKEHWESVYGTKSDAELSWTQPEPSLSLSLIRDVCPAGRVIDVGGGNSLLAERLLDRGYSVTVLDISETATRHARERLAARATQVDWIVADVIASPELDTFDVWHDRAVFHFLTEAADRAAYVALLSRTIPPGRHAVIATFAPDGPPRCSGLDVRRYSGLALSAELGAGFERLKTVPETHVTPSGAPQSFQYSVFKRV